MSASKIVTRIIIMSKEFQSECICKKRSYIKQSYISPWAAADGNNPHFEQVE